MKGGDKEMIKEFSMGNRAWAGLVAGLISAAISALIISIAGSSVGVFGEQLVLTLVVSLAIGAGIGLIYGLIVNPAESYLSSLTQGIVLSLVLWIAFALYASLFMNVALISGFTLVSLLSIAIYGILTTILYSWISNWYGSYEMEREEPIMRITEERQTFYEKRHEKEEKEEKENKQ